MITHALLPWMKGRGWGRIVNITSGSVSEGVVGRSHYVAAKAGIVGFTRSLLGNAATLRAILDREPRTLRAFIEELI